MIKIAHVREMTLISELPVQVIKAIKDVVTILDDEYGEFRDVDKDYGGYALVLESEDELELLEHLASGTIIFEYVDQILCEDGRVFVSALTLLGSDFGIVLIMPFEMFNKKYENN
ncbi:MAG TPA: hypothetical protein VIM51_10965 [Desulfosporosinus sp.]